MAPGSPSGYLLNSLRPLEPSGALRGPPETSLGTSPETPRESFRALRSSSEPFGSIGSSSRACPLVRRARMQAPP
eukprot:10868777-Alexandrium_andersonii.AAC.1